MRNYMSIIKKLFGVRRCIYIPVLLLIAIGYIIAGVSPNVEVRHVYGVLPAFVWHNPTLFKTSKRVVGTVKGPVILVFDDHIADEPASYKRDEIKTTIQHELIHVRQGYRTLFLYASVILLRYNYFIDNYPKLATIGLKVLITAEAEAYAKTEKNISATRLATLLYYYYVPAKARPYNGKNLISYAYVLEKVKKYRRSSDVQTD